MRQRLTGVLAVCAVFVAACAGNQGGSRHAHTKYRPTHRTYAGGYHPAVGKLPASDMPLVVNDRVIKWVNYFTAGKGRDSFSRYLQRSGKFLPMMRETLRRKGMPQDLVYLALIESGFRNDAKSHASAVGTWQFIRSTGMNYGLDIDSLIDERRDPEKAVAAAADYLRNLHGEFGDWYLAMAGYNAGEGRIRQAVNQCGSRNFWDITNARCVLRPETQDYVPKYIAATIIAKNPKQFGFTGIDYHAPLNYETVTVAGQADLDTVAEAAGVPAQSVRELNAALHAGVTPPGNYAVKVPVGTAHKVERNLAKLAGQPRTVMAGYTVRRGDTLEQIARKNGVPAQRLMAINGLASRKVRRGMVLNVPRDHVLRAKVVGVDTTPAIARLTGGSEPLVRNARGYHSSREPLQVASAEPVRQSASYASDATPVDRSGVAAIIGQDTRQQPTLSASTARRAVLPTAASVAAPDAAPMPTAADAVAEPLAQTHSVERGDSLGKISRMYGIAEADLRRWNNVGNQRVLVGQTMRLTDPAAAPTVSVEPTMDDTTVAAVPNGDQPSDLAVSSMSERVTPTVVLPRVAATPHVKKSAPIEHRVTRGDTLSGIARKYGVALVDLRRWNKHNGGALRAGQTLRLTNGASAVAVKTAPINDRVATNAIASVKKGAGAKAKGKSVVHNVKAGDTLWVLAKRYKVTPNQIQSWNKMTGKQNLKPGQKLTIRVSS